MMTDFGRALVALGAGVALSFGAANGATAPASPQAQATQDAAQAQAQARAQAQAAAREAAQAAREAAREAARAVRDAQLDAARAGRIGEPAVFAQPPFPPVAPQIPPEAVMISIAFFIMCAVIAIGFPIARAIARRMDRKSVAAVSADPDTRSRLERIEHAVDAIAVEVERISEGQRFTTKVLADLRAIPETDAAASRRLGNA